MYSSIFATRRTAVIKIRLVILLLVLGLIAGVSFIEPNDDCLFETTLTWNTGEPIFLGIVDESGRIVREGDPAVYVGTG